MDLLDLGSRCKLENTVTSFLIKILKMFPPPCSTPPPLALATDDLLGVGVEEPTLTRASFLDCLRSGEERMEDAELTECLEALMGTASEGGKWETRPARRGGAGSAMGLGDGDRVSAVIRGCVRPSVSILKNAVYRALGASHAGYPALFFYFIDESVW